MKPSTLLPTVESLLIFSGLFLVATAEARLGERPIEFVDRYGLHKKLTLSSDMGVSLLQNAEVRHYEKGGWRVSAAFLDIASPAVRIEFQKTNNTALTVEEINAILDANSGGKIWTRKVYRNPSASSGEPVQLVGEAIVAPLLEWLHGREATEQWRHFNFV